MTTTRTQADVMDDVQVRRSWKLPIVYTLAALLLAFFSFTAKGEVTIRLNDKSQAFEIPDLVLGGAGILWVLLALVALVAVWSIVTTSMRAKSPRWVQTCAMLLAGIATTLAFLIYAGTGSSGVVTLTSTLVSTVAISTPLIFGALSGVVSEHVGVVNIAIEGDLLVGAFAGVMAASFFQTPYAGLVAAPLAGALLGSLLALFSVRYGVDQIIVGVVLNVLALGLTTFFYGTLKIGRAHV